MLFINQYFWFSLLFLGFNAVFDTNEENIIENLEVVAKEKVSAEVLLLNPNQGVVYFGDNIFSGIGVANYANGIVSEEITYLNGKRDGFRKRTRRFFTYREHFTH